MKLKRHLSTFLVLTILLGMLSIVTVNAQSVQNASIVSNSTVDFSIGTVTLIFDTVVDLAQLRENFSFTKADGTPIKGGYCLQTATDANSVNVKFGDLEYNTNYLITTTQAYGSYSLPFKSSGMIADENFQTYSSDYDIYSKLTKAKEGLVMSDYGSEKAKVKILQDGENKYLNIEATPTGAGKTVDYVMYANGFGNLTSDQLLITAKYKYYAPDNTAGTARSRVFSRISEDSNINNKFNNFVTIEPNGTTANKVKVNGIGSNIPSINANDFTDYKVLYKPENGKYALGIKVGNNQVTNSTLGNRADYKADGVAISKNVESIQSVLLAHTYAKQDVSNASSIAIDDLQIQKLTSPKLIYTSLLSNNNVLSNEGGELALYFSNDLNASSISLVDLKNSMGNSVKTNITYNANERKALLTYGALEPNNTYTLSLEGISSINGVAGKNETQTFTTLQSNEFVLNGADISSSDVAVDIGKVKLTFSKDVDFDTLASNISLTKNDDSAIEGIYNISAGTTKNEVVLNFGELGYNTTYKISVNAGALSTNAEPVKPKIISFETQSMIANENFDSYNTSQNVINDLKTGINVGKGKLKLFDTSSGGYHPSITIKEDAKGNKYLDVYSKPLNNQDTNIELYATDFGNVTDGNVLITAKYNYYSGDESDTQTVGLARGRVLSRLKQSDNVIKDYLVVNNNNTVSSKKSISEKNDIIPNTFNDYNILYKKTDAGFKVTANINNNAPFVSNRGGETNDSCVNDIGSILVGHMYGKGIGCVAGGVTITEGQYGSFAIDDLQIRKINEPKVLSTTIQNGETNVSTVGGTFAISYTNDIAPDYTNVKMKNSQGNEVNCTASYDAPTRSILLTYNSLEESENYTVEIPAQVSTDGLFSKSQMVSFSASGAQKFKYVSTDLPSLTNVLCDIGSITVTFNNPIDATTINNITLKDNLGNAVSNLQLFAKNNTCELTFGTLQGKTNYVIDLPSTLKSESGATLVATKINFSTISPYYVDENFESYVVADGIDTHPNGNENIKYTSNGSVNNTDNMYVLSENGNKYLRIYGKANTRKDNIAQVDVDVSGKKTVVVDLKARAGVDGGIVGNVPRQVGKMFNGSLSSEILSFNSVGCLTTPSARVTAEGVGWHRVKMVYTPDSNGIYKADLYDGDEYKMSYYGNKNLDNITSIMLGHVYNNTQTNGWTELDDIKVYYVNAPKVSKTTLKNNIMNIKETSFGIYFDSPMKASSVVPENIQVKQGDTVIPTIGAYDATQNKYTLFFSGDYLIPDAQYIVTFNGVLSKDLIAMTDMYTFKGSSLDISVNQAYFTKTPNGDKITLLNDTTSIYANVTLENNTSVQKQAMIIISVYNKDNKVVKISTKNFPVNANAKLNVFDFGITDLIPANGNYAKIFVWENDNQLCPSLSIPVAIIVKN